jgi:hypothetical protein
MELESLKRVHGFQRGSKIVFCLLVFSCHTQSGDKPKKDLSKRGYKTNKKLEKINNHTIWWRPTRIYYLNVAIFKEDI